MLGIMQVPQGEGAEPVLAPLGPSHPGHGLLRQEGADSGLSQPAEPQGLAGGRGGGASALGPQQPLPLPGLHGCRHRPLH